MKKILFSITSQFGYHTDTYMYCKYLDKTKYEVHYVGFDGGQVSRELDDVEVHYIPVHQNKMIRYWVYLTTINKLIRNENFDILFLVDCQGSLLIRICNLFRKAILDIRTGDTQLGRKRISFFNIFILLSSVFFKRVTIISLSLRKLLRLSANKCHLLPLGAVQLDMPNKSFDSLNLFYIGTIHGRNINQTIEGLSIFKTNQSKVLLKYNIVGFGSAADEVLLKDSIEHYNLTDVVIFHGRKNHDEAMDLFQKCNVGVVYIPITKGYTCQPTTKLYECLLAGMPVIATSTLENKLSVKQQTGVLINDNPEAFAQGLEEIWNRKNEFNSEVIKSLYLESTWENIVRHNLEPYLEKLLQ